MTLSAMNAAEQLYVDNRMAGNPPLVAARLAGFENPQKKAPELEKDERVRDAIENTIKVETYQMQIDRDTVLAGLMDAVNMAQTATELVSAWREIGKVIGAYEPQKVDVNVTDKRQLQELDDNELARLAAIEGEYEVLDFKESDDEAIDGEQTNGSS